METIYYVAKRMPGLQMTDIVDAQTRSRMMANIKGKNTKPELDLRKALHRKGFRYRIHNAALPGKPDVVLSRHRAVIFVHGCFWHHHEGCRYATTPATRQEFWLDKFQQNRQRDVLATSALEAAGWRVATVWECALKKPSDVEGTANLLSNWIVSERPRMEIGSEDLPIFRLKD